MFVLDMESAIPHSDVGNDTGALLVVWRYVPHYRYRIRNGVPTAKPSAFKIRRNPDGSAKEPSASLFELSGKAPCSESNAIYLMGLLISEKNFKGVEANDGSGSLKVSDVKELLKDPRAFILAKTAKQSIGSLVHWDLTYTADDRAPDMLVAKSQLAHICKIYVTGGAALSTTSPGLLPKPSAT